MVRISENDRRIIDILRRNARTPYTRIAEDLGVTEAAVRKRVRRLEEEGVIKKYTIEVDTKKLGYNVRVFVGFDVEPESYTKVVEVVREFPEIQSLYATTGDHMFMAECWFRDRSELEKFVKKLESVPGVTRVCPAIVVERIK